MRLGIAGTPRAARDMLAEVWERHGVLWHQTIIWVKDRPVLTRSWYMWQSEPCAFGWLKGNKPKRKAEGLAEQRLAGGNRFRRLRKRCIRPRSRWSYLRYRCDNIRPLAICATSRSAAVAVRIVAAENLGRQCRAIELAPEFVGGRAGAVFGSV